MDKLTRSCTTVPMSRHENGLHEGHKALIDIATDIGNQVVVPIVPMDVLYPYLVTGILPSRQVNIDIRRQIQDILDKGAYSLIVPFIPVTEENRLRWLTQATNILEQFQQYIYSPFQYSMALGMIMNLCRYNEISVNPVKYTVRGPEFHQFLAKAVYPLLGIQTEVIIADKIYKHPNSKIKLQDGVEKVDPLYRDEINQIPALMEGIKDQLHVGANDELVTELNTVYRHVHWKINSISVHEGGIVPGRLTTVEFIFPSIDGRTILIREVDYESYWN